MFKAKTERIKELEEYHSGVIAQLNGLFGSSVRMYIDYANVRPWSTKLGWHIELKRLKQFLDSFDVIRAVNFYSGYLEGDLDSEREIKEVESLKYVVRTKPVKIMRIPIDASSIPRDSTALLDHFIKRSLLRKYDLQTVEYLNDRFADLNRKGELYIEDRKCNFDVEMSVDMLLDAERNETETFAFWSGDSDFADPAERLMKSGKKVILFGTTGKISRELSELRAKGLVVFEIKKIRDFICWKKEMNSKGDPNKGAPKL